MHRWERPQGFLKEPSVSERPGRRKRRGNRLFWREIVVSSRLYGRSRWLHSPGRDESELGGHRSGGED
jgi:hypothetical protein